MAGGLEEEVEEDAPGPELLGTFTEVVAPGDKSRLLAQKKSSSWDTKFHVRPHRYSKLLFFPYQEGKWLQIFFLQRFIRNVDGHVSKSLRMRKQNCDRGLLMSKPNKYKIKIIMTTTI